MAVGLLLLAAFDKRWKFGPYPSRHRCFSIWGRGMQCVDVDDVGPRPRVGPRRVSSGATCRGSADRRAPAWDGRAGPGGALVGSARPWAKLGRTRGWCSRHASQMPQRTTNSFVYSLSLRWASFSQKFTASLVWEPLALGTAACHFRKVDFGGRSVGFPNQPPCPNLILIKQPRWFVPLAVIDIRWKLDPMPLATDASASGGAVCSASMLTGTGHALALVPGASLRAPHAARLQFVGVQPETLGPTQVMRSLSLPVLRAWLILDF